MNVSVIGTGYVGLVSGTCFAEIGHNVTCIDVVKEKIDMLKAGQCPIYEPGLTELIARNVKNDRLHFSTDYSSVKDAKSIFLAVGTPSSDSGQANLDYLKAAAISVAKELSDDAIVVIKSTVPVGTNKMIRELIAQNTTKRFHVVNNPEFLKEGSAVEDFMRPDRVIIGHDDEHAAKVMEELYAPLVRQGNPIYMMSNLSAEMSKYAANCFLAAKISFINEIARLCDSTGADIEEVRKGISSDRRIGGHFLYPGPGYGGSCFPKDVRALIHTAKEHDLKLRIVQASEDVNKEQKVYMIKKIRDYYKGNIKGKTFAFWGAAFKANTDDIRESSAIDMAKALIEEGAKVHVYDPVATPNFLKAMGSNVNQIRSFENMYECVSGTDGLITVTEWREFRNPDFDKLKEMLNHPVIFDGRNLYPTKKIIDAGFDYFAVGKRVP